MRLNVVLIGPPGSGKGTQAVRLAERYSIPHISTGDILRAAVRAGTDLGRKVASTLENGGLVSDDLMTDLVRDRLTHADTKRGFVLDGFPRTVVQAEALDSMVNSAPLIVVLLDVASEAIVRRLGKRRVCESCGITQSVSDEHDAEHNPCAYCGGNLIRRQDDDPATVCRRLTTYASFAEPVINYYQSRATFGSVDGLQGLEVVTNAMCRHIDVVAAELSDD